MGLLDGIMNMFNNSEYTCKECGTTMNKADDEVIVCPECGYSIDISDYGSDADYDEYYSSEQSAEDEPECCKTCGGPYPDCMTSCKIFDD